MIRRRLAAALAVALGIAGALVAVAWFEHDNVMAPSAPQQGEQRT